jgi:hypothetical protein
MSLKPANTRIVWIAVTFVFFGANGIWYWPSSHEFIRTASVVSTGSGELSDADGIDVFESREDFLLRGYGAAIETGVDFSKENLVRIRWHADGPGFGTLRHRVRLFDSRAFFFVETPTVDNRTFSRIHAEDWFIVPRGTSVLLTQQASIRMIDWMPFGLLVLWMLAGLKFLRRIQAAGNTFHRGQPCVQAG